MILKHIEAEAVTVDAKHIGDVHNFGGARAFDRVCHAEVTTHVRGGIVHYVYLDGPYPARRYLCSWLCTVLVTALYFHCKSSLVEHYYTGLLIILLLSFILLSNAR